MVAEISENLETLTDEQIRELTDEQLGDHIDIASSSIQRYCGRDSEICDHYHEQIKRYWAEEHRRNS